MKAAESREIFVRAPARVNLIGGHTDYNGGHVLPAALSLEITARGRAGDDRMVSVRAPDEGGRGAFSLDDIRPGGGPAWLEYIKGVCHFLQEEGFRVKGADFSVSGDIPRGAGLSSSAALEVAAALFFQGISGFRMAPAETAELCRRAENEFVGMRCGIMDQFACCLGKKGSAVFLDCSSLEFELVPLPENVKIVICNTGVRRELASSEYNKRREECERAASMLGVDLLGKLTMEDFESRAVKLPGLLFRRARHVVSENERVVKAAAALRKGDLHGLGGLLRESHRSLRDDFEVSCAELDLMADIASRADGVYGSRMTGAGFGGCSVNLVEAESAGNFREAVGREYLSKTGITPEIYVSEASDGAGFME